MLKIPCNYETFEAIRDVICSEVPFALINAMYSKKLGEAFFNFWDSDYIPDDLKKFIMNPPTSREQKQRMREKLSQVVLIQL